MSLPPIASADVARSVDLVASLWARGMAAAAWQTAALGGFVALACRVCPRMPARGRHWLWWLVCLKAIVALVPATIAVPVLSTQMVRATQALPVVGHAITKGPVAVAIRAPLSAPTTTTSQPIPAATEPALVPHPLSPLADAFLVWAVLTAQLALGTAVGGRRSAPRRLRPVADPTLLEEAVWIAREMRIRTPRIAAGDVAVFCVAGLARPVIVVPAGQVGRLPREEIRMALAHEMAHIRGRDLRLGLVPALAGVLFWPLFWIRIAAREYLAAREEACDGAALAVGDRADYARMLLRYSVPGGQIPAAALSPAYAMARRRLMALSAKPASRAVSAWLALFCTVAALAQAPIRLVPRAVALVRAMPGPGIGRYRLVDLGPLTGETDGVSGMNDRNDVAMVEEGRPVVFRGGKVVPLPGLPHYRLASSTAVSGDGMIAATACNYESYPHAYVPGGLHALLGLARLRYATVGGVNSAHVVAGSVQSGQVDIQGAEVAHAVIWTNGRPQEIGTLGGDYSRAYAINDAGDVVGKADLPRNYLRDTLHGYVRPTHAFLWQDGRMRDLDTLGGRNSLASAINSRGQAAGFSETADGSTHACLWQSGAPIDLGTLPGGSASQADAVADTGIAVGMSEAASGDTHATAWMNGRTVDLNEQTALRGWTLSEAKAINNHGWIAGVGSFAGRQRAFLLVPLP